MTQFLCEDRRQLGDRVWEPVGLHQSKELYKLKLFAHELAGKSQPSALSQAAVKGVDIVSRQTLGCTIPEPAF